MGLGLLAIRGKTMRIACAEEPDADRREMDRSGQKQEYSGRLSGSLRSYPFIPVICRQVMLAGGLGGELVASFVSGISRMPLHPDKMHVMPVTKRQQAFPQINIQGFTTGSFAPVVLPPASGPPFGDPIDHVSGVTVKGDG